MLDERKDRSWDAMQEFHANIEVPVVLALSGPHDLPVHLEGLFCQIELDDDPDDGADREIPLAADPGSGHGKVVGIGVDHAVSRGSPDLAFVLDVNIVELLESLVFPVIHFAVLRAPSK